MSGRLSVRAREWDVGAALVRDCPTDRASPDQFRAPKGRAHFLDVDVVMLSHEVYFVCTARVWTRVDSDATTITQW